MTTPHHADPAAFTDAELMEAIAFERKGIERAEATKGPIVAARFIEAHIYPHLVPLLEEKARRMAARRAAR